MPPFRADRHTAWSSIERSVPRIQDAVRLFDLVRDALGERGELDDWVFPHERALLLRDLEHPRWHLPQRLLYLAVGLQEQVLPVAELPEQFRAPPPPVRKPDVVALNPGGTSGRLRAAEGEASFEVLYDDQGLKKEVSLRYGDDPREPIRGQRAPLAPLSLVTREDLRATGHPLEEFARMLTELRGDQAHAGRVYSPVFQPGGIPGSWLRGLWNLRRACWEGAVGPDGGWAVIDAWRGMVVATGATFDEAVSAWNTRIREVQPLPPADPAPEPEPAPAPDVPPTADYDEEARRLTLSNHFRIEIRPPMMIPWPEPRPENVPAVAVPIPAAPAIPDGLARIGFDQVLRLVGDEGQAAFAFVRHEGTGLTIVGDDAVDALVPETLDADLDAADAAQRADWATWPAQMRDEDPWDHPPYPVRIIGYTAWDRHGKPALKATNVGWSAELGPHGWDTGMGHGVVRARYLQVG